jgi:hypothetical protein
MISPLAVSVALLAISLLGNAILLGQWRQAEDAAIRAEEGRTGAMAAAQNCGEAVKALQDAAEKQRAEAQAAIEAAQKVAARQRRIAEAERRRPQAVPGNACASAAVETREWLERRRAGE